MRLVMNSRMSGLFRFDKKEGAAAPVEPAPKAPAPAEVPSANDHAKTAIAEMIADLAKSEPRSKAAAPARPVRQERRHRRRVKISAPVRVRQVNFRQASEFDLTMTADVSREGILFETSRSTYHRGQQVAVVFPYRAMLPGEPVHEQRGLVVRVVRASENRYGVAVAFVDGDPDYEIVDALGNPIGQEPDHALTKKPAKSGEKPLVILVDADARVRTLVRSELEAQGYTVESVADPGFAAAILRQRKAVAVVCEAESFPGALPGGGEMSGYDLCVILRRNAKFAHIPVILTTRTGMPSDFSTAHALGATVCISKPYDVNRLLNLLRMLAPFE
jgi:CheY-like chemotaxis protein